MEFVRDQFDADAINIKMTKEEARDLQRVIKGDLYWGPISELGDVLDEWVAEENA